MFPEAKLFLSYAMTEACSSMTFSLLASPTSAVPVYDSMRDANSTHISSDSEHALEASAAAPASPAVCVGFPAAGVEVTIRQSENLPPGKSASS